jgi:Homeodomain-like domain
MALGRPIPLLQLSREERETLERWSRRHTTAQALALRCRMVRACAEGRSNTAVAGRLLVTIQTVGKWRHRFVERRLWRGCSMSPALGLRGRSATTPSSGY